MVIKQVFKAHIIRMVCFRVLKY